MQLFDEEFYLVICSLIFVYLVYKPIKKVILKSLDDKIASIKDQVSEAQKLNDETTLLFENVVNQIQQLETLGDSMLKSAQENADSMIAQQNQEIDKFVEEKKLETFDLINRKKLEASEVLHSEFYSRIMELVEIYMQSADKEILLDSEIAKKLMQLSNSKNSTSI